MSQGARPGESGRRHGREGAGSLERLRRGGTLSMGGSRQLGGMELGGHGVSAPVDVVGDHN